MADLAYPSSLPAPAVWSQQRTERRTLRDLREPANAVRGRSRDPIISAQAEWVYSAAEMAVWRAWYEGSASGQVARLRWFSAPLPGRGGLLDRVCRYMAPPTRTHIGAGIWRVSAPMQVRGAGVAPQQDASTADPVSFELREDGSRELREDATFELRG